ncbi:LysR family transcriptional regulator [Pelistega sp. MC2]|uniref:LysR family transcriptional regulator n=1 Tax=Pelistega sp. MC2 TaxID=1720297 RepID=UPI000ADDE3BD|nr:LysR family transcriptional regulator [Pelistega sp. MC2]
MMNISLRQLKAFVTVAESGSFTQAATRLHLTQSALSGLMKELESQVGFRLFDRTTRQLSLSGAGVRLLPLAVQVLNDIASFEDEADKLKDGRLGDISVSVSQQLAASFMPYFLADFKKTYPETKIHLQDCSIEQVIQQVQSAEVDFGIGPDRVLPDDVEATPWFSLPFYAVVPKNHPTARQQKVSWRTLFKEPLISLTGSFNRHLSEELPADLSERIMAPDYEVNFLSTALGMVHNGLGVSLCLPYAGDWVRQHDLVMMPLVEPIIHRRFYLYSRKNKSLSTIAVLFKDYLLNLSESMFYR